jgi:hypothetical protein
VKIEMPSNRILLIWLRFYLQANALLHPEADSPAAYPGICMS